jgi:predicted membrane channel-forming protein YqfA (hemolysin III family)
MLHDLTDAFLATIGVIDMKEYERLLNEPTFWRYLLLTLYLIYFCWFVTLFTIGIKKANKFNFFKSIILGILGLAVYQTILFIFIR